ncbi:CoA transferase [Streptosporangium amethystogenes]|uniref:CoA transferase n=1 Tax=Streptosporangium amethystogenes TaxID=2002 RepID=UPI0009FF8552|nr:CoA transferase [Streptosporangium amethystogenes]
MDVVRSGVTAGRPLSGTAVRALGDSTALRVAVRRLRALGCAVETGNEPPPDGAPAGWLGVTRLPFTVLDGALPECRIGWSGPVAVPMAGEHDVQAACGIMQVHGRAVGGPRPLRVDYASVCAGVLAVQAVSAGVLALLRGGPALAAATSAAQAALLALTQYVAAATAEPGLGSPGPVGAAGYGAPLFRSADGVRFEIETLDAEDWRRFWTELGVAPAAVATGWPAFQQRFATATCSLPTALGTAVAALDYRAVRVVAERSGVSVLPVRAADAPGLLPPAPVSPWRLRGQVVTDPASALPPLGPHDHAPLAGLRVVEATSRVQGPLSGHLLGLLGAEVVRLEPPGGDPMRGVPPMAGECSARFQALNRGKRVVEADLKSVPGRRAVLRLIAAADVFLHNWPPGRAVRLGLDHEALAAVRPCLVHAHAGGWADLLPDPQPLATDYLVQAYCGVAALVGGPGEPPAPSLLTLTDVLGGLISAEGIVAALLARSRTGAGVRAETALVDAARLIRDAAVPHGRGDATRTGAGIGAASACSPARWPGRTGAVTVVTDLAEMAADPAFSTALDIGGEAVYSRAPWTFVPATAPLWLENAR